MFTRTLTEISEFSITREEWKGGRMEEWRSGDDGNARASLIDSVTLSALPIFIWHSWA
jgi:hypothetical protein